MACYRLGLFSSDDRADPDNALFHVNRVLDSPIEYTDPQSLMDALMEYIEETEGDILL